MISCHMFYYRRADNGRVTYLPGSGDNPIPSTFQLLGWTIHSYRYMYMSAGISAPLVFAQPWEWS